MSKPWFPVKKYGYGAGLPHGWQGWTVLAVYFSAVAFVVLSEYGQTYPLRHLAAIALLTAIVVLVSWAKSDRPWRWRNGDDD